MKPFISKTRPYLIPLLIVFWGIFNLYFFDPFSSKSSDPEFPYLVNGLNCGTFKFNFIGHIDHPGTPLQVYNGMIIRFTHLFAGRGDVATDVFARPDFYLNVISGSLFILQAVLVLFIGFLGLRRKIPFWQIAILQAACFYNDVLMWFFCRVNPDRFFMIAVSIFVLIYLKHGYENRSPRKFAVWSGAAMALGLATKFNFLPVLFLPLLLIETNRNRLIYMLSGIVSFFIFIAPIINKFDDFFRFITGIFKHDGLYGGGESRILNLQKITESLFEIFRLNPELVLLILSLIGLIVWSIRRKEEGTRKFTFLFSGYLFIIAMQVLMVSKHFKNYYLAPTFFLYGFIFFTVSLFLSKILKQRLILVCSLLPVLFLLTTAVKVRRDHAVITRLIAQREKIRTFVDKEISKADYWFIEPTWESGPQVENALVYGLSYCGHREEYLQKLMTVNPNIITYEGNNDEVRLWRCGPVSLDSVVATGKNIYIHSSPDRHASILVQMAKNAAGRNNIELACDTVFSDPETMADIIRIKATNSKTNWFPGKVSVNDRQSQIDEYIRAINNTPEWLAKVKEKAMQKKIPLDSMILLDAIWMVDSPK